MKKKVLVLFLMVFSFFTLIGCDDIDISALLTTNETTTQTNTTVVTDDLTSESTTTLGEVTTSDLTEQTTEEPTSVETTTEVPTTEEPTTEVPTTEAPTTEVPTTEEPTTEAPTTEEPTTEVPTTEEPTTDGSYYDDYVDLSDVHSMNDNTDLTVSGVVYFLTQNGYYIQDNTGNLFIYTSSSPSVSIGDRVVVSGLLTTYRDVKQIGDDYTLIETNATNQTVNLEVLDFSFDTTVLQAGVFYEITGEVRIEGTYDTAYLYQGSTMVAEIYYQSLANSVSAIKDYEGEVITLDLLYYGSGDNTGVARFAFQGDSSEISVEVPDNAQAILVDADLLPSEKSLSGDMDFGQGFYGSVYTIIDVTGDASNYVLYEGSLLTVVQPEEAIGNVTGVITISVSLGDETPLVRTIDLTIRAENSSSSDLAYYESADGLSGAALLAELHAIINQGFNQLSYDDAKWVLEESDRDPNNSNNIILVYTRESVQGQWNYPNWNREHTWPQSKLNYAGQKADMHNLKPSDVDENSSRGNKAFGNVTTGSTYEPPNEVKGDVARIVFYMSVMYSDLDVTSGILGDLETLLEWNEMDPVDDFERNRNEVIYSHQGNRNPFIDNSDYADLIWG